MLSDESVPFSNLKSLQIKIMETLFFIRDCRFCRFTQINLEVT